MGLCCSITTITISVSRRQRGGPKQERRGREVKAALSNSHTRGSSILRCWAENPPHGKTHPRPAGSARRREAYGILSATNRKKRGRNGNSTTTSEEKKYGLGDFRCGSCVVVGRLRNAARRGTIAA